MKKKAPKPIKVNFSDGAKRRAGVDPSDYAKEVARVKREHDGIVALKDARIETLTEAVRNAVAASEEGRRGDCVRILRAVLPKALPTDNPPAPQEPRSA